MDNTPTRKESPEQEWSKKIPSGLICQWYYAFFIINAVIAALAISAFVFTVIASPKSVFKFQTLLHLFTLLLTSGIGVVNTLFFYLICSRSLL
jgi:hypothetical protein